MPRMAAARTVFRATASEAADMTGQTDDALVPIERVLVSRDLQELALAGFRSAYRGSTLDKQRG